MGYKEMVKKEFCTYMVDYMYDVGVYHNRRHQRLYLANTGFWFLDFGTKVKWWAKEPFRGATNNGWRDEG